MAKDVKGARFVLKRTDSAGEIPTVPPNDDHTTGWDSTAIYKGELFLNITDDKMWFRDNNDKMVGLVPLNSGGTIDTSYLPGNYLGAMIYQGTWDASTGSAPSTTPEKGDYWIVSVSGNTDLDGETDWKIGDFAIYNGATWDKIDNTEPEISSINVLYANSYYSGLTNVSDSCDFLLDNYNIYLGSSNITIVDDGSGHLKTISLVANPTVTNLTATNIDISGNLFITGTTISTSSITAQSLYTYNTIHFTENIGNYIVSNGLGIKFYEGNVLRLEFDNSGIKFYGSNVYGDNVLRLEFDNSGIATTYSKMRYDVTGKTFNDNRDFVDKGYLDSQIALHNVGLWSSGSTAYKFLAWDGGVNTHYVGINVADPTYNLHVIGTTHLNGTTINTGNVTIDGDFIVNDGVSYKLLHIESDTNYRTRIGDMDNATNGNYLELNPGVDSTLRYFGAGGNEVFNIDGTGTVNIGHNLTVDGSIELGTDNSDELILKGTHVTIANIGGTDNINLGFAADSVYGDQVIGILPKSTTSNAKNLTIHAQTTTNTGSYNGGDLILNGGNSNGSTGGIGGNVIINAGTGHYDGNVVINENSNYSDLRVESNNNINMLFVDGGQDRVGIGTNSPASTFDVVGDIHVSDSIYTFKGSFTTTGNKTIISNAVEGDIFLINAFESYMDETGPRYINAIVMVSYDYYDTDLCILTVNTINNLSFTITGSGSTSSDIDILLNNVRGGDMVTSWSALKLN